MAERNRSVSKSHNGKEIFFLFFLWPALALLPAVRDFSKRNNRIIIYFFLILFGFTFVNLNPSIDSARIGTSFKEIVNRPFSEFWVIISGLYTETSVDFIQALIIFTVSRITSSEHVLFGIFAAFFGWFYIKSIELVYNKEGLSRNPDAIIHILFFVFVIPIFFISGFRFWTAAWVFFYGAYNVVVSGKKRFLIFTILSAFIHFSFLSANLVLMTYMLLGNRNKIYFILFIVSIIIPEVLTPQIERILNSIGGPIGLKIDIYTDKSYMMQRKESQQNLAWFMKLYGNGMYYYIIVMLFYIKLKIRKLASDKRFENLFSFSLLFLSVYNFVKYIPSSGRFITVFYLFGLTYLITFFYRYKRLRPSVLTLIGLVPMILGIAINLRIGSNVTSPWLFSPIPVMFWAEPVSILDFFR